MKEEIDAVKCLLWEDYCRYGKVRNESWPPTKEKFKKALEDRLDYTRDNDRH